MSEVEASDLWRHVESRKRAFARQHCGPGAACSRVQCIDKPFEMSARPDLVVPPMGSRRRSRSAAGVTRVGG